MSFAGIKEFRRRRDAILLGFAVAVALTGFLAALYSTHETERLDWVGLSGTVVDKRLKFQEDQIYGSSVQAILSIEVDSRGRIETRVPLSLYQKAQIGDWVEGSKKTLKFYATYRDRAH